MLQQQHITSSWGLGLNEEQVSLLRKTLGDEHLLVPFAGLSDAPQEDTLPFMFWLYAKELRELAASPESLRQKLEEAPKALLLDPGYDLADFEAACDLGVTDIVRPPFVKERIVDIMRRALEMRSIAVDMDCMSREISVERELLERKNDILAFLVSFLTHSMECQGNEDLLAERV